jgi:hypothetical protein
MTESFFWTAAQVVALYILCCWSYSAGKKRGRKQISLATQELVNDMTRMIQDQNKLIALLKVRNARDEN